MRFRDLHGKRRVGGKPTDTPTGHGPGLGEAIDHHGLLAQLRMAQRKTLVTACVYQAVVHIVTDHVDARLGSDTRHGIERSRIEDAAGGIVGRANDNGLGRRRHAVA